MKVKVSQYKIEVTKFHALRVLFAILLGVSEFLAHEHEAVTLAIAFIVYTTAKDVWEGIETCGKFCRAKRHRAELTEKALSAPSPGITT
jgi:hypothetical protein